MENVYKHLKGKDKLLLFNAHTAINTIKNKNSDSEDVEKAIEIIFLIGYNLGINKSITILQTTNKILENYE